MLLIKKFYSDLIHYSIINIYNGDYVKSVKTAAI